MTIPYTAKYLRGETFAFRVENALVYSLENFCGSMLVEFAILPIDKAGKD